MICYSVNLFLFIIRLHPLGRTLNLSGGTLQRQIILDCVPSSEGGGAMVTGAGGRQTELAGAEIGDAGRHELILIAVNP